MARARYKQREDGRYGTMVTIGTKPDGSRDRVQVYASSSRELERKVAELKAKHAAGLAIKSSDMLLSDYAIQWDKTYNLVKSINTRAMYANIVNKHIVPAIGHIPLSKLVKSDIQGLINERSDKRRTCEQLVLVMRQIIRTGISDRLLPANAIDMCRGLSLPEKTPSNKRALTDTEKKAIRDAEFSDQERAFIYILFFFGLRREEALALMKSDLNWKTRNLTISRAVIFDGNNPILKTTKSSYSVRTLHIPSGAYDVLRSYVRDCDSMYLFHDGSGQFLTKSMYRKRWDAILARMNEAVTTDKEKKLGVRKINGLTAHIFRHNYCTELYYSGVSIKAAVQMMGHRDSKMIMEVYSHLDSKREDVENKLDKSLSI